MRMKNRELENINSSGGLLSEHFLVLMREDSISLPFAAPKTFKLPWSKADESLDKKEYDRRVSESWNKLLERWDLYGYGKLQRMDPADARARWTGPLLEALGFEPVATPKHIEISESMKFRFSHRGWIESPDNGKPPVVHIVPPAQDLDERSEKGTPSPHDALQAYLNVHHDKWGLVTNGLYLRLLRDYHHTYTKGYVEFDLEAIFLTRSFSDFQALYRIAHASRFLPADAGEVYLEEYFKHSQSVGEKVGAGLRKNVLQAITTLGNGFLDAELLSELKSDPAQCHKFYEEILKTIYRIIFLLYAEQRGMLGSAAEHNLYLEEYSLTALRERAASYGRVDGHKDHWIGLKNTFKIIWKGSHELGICPYNGMLFETSDEEYTSKYDCKNSELLEAIRYLTLTEIDGTARRISYSEIDVTEIGAIYEGLLEYTPRVIDQPEEIECISYSANSFILDPRGSARKTSGSYYTHQDLVQELIKSALEPVLAERLRNAGPDKEARDKAILSIKVCDMTSGSGAFLIAACNRLALELARVRMEPAVPDDDAIQEAKRDVLQSCIYGVDLNPMAVELAKVSLWINAMVKDKPLNFLDHHIKCGNSLIGATPELIAQGVPDGAFEAVTGDDKKVAKYFKDINKKQRKGTLDKWIEKAQPSYVEEFARLANMEEDSARGVVDKCRAYHKLKDTEELRKMRLEADAWTAAFFLPLTEMSSLVPTSGEVKRLGSQALLDDSLTKKVTEIADKYRFFHWYLEFPEIFAAGGFDVILGNPPWEKIKLEEKEFFADKDIGISNAMTAVSRGKLIKKLTESNPILLKEYIDALSRIDKEGKFLRSSGRFPLAGIGDVNTYPIFVELAVRELLAPKGKIGIVVKTGIATDYSTRYLFADLVEKSFLVSLYDFVNSERIFAEVAPPERFCLLTLSGKENKAKDFEFSFYNSNFAMLLDETRKYKLNSEEIKQLNPNTLNCPIFKTKKDKEITQLIYQSTSILIDKKKKYNPWGIKYHTMIHMANDSHLFAENTKEKLESLGFILGKDGIFRGENDIYLPLYEAKYINVYDHRFGTFKGTPPESRFKGRAQPHAPSDDNKKDINYEIEARYWIRKKDFESKFNINWNKGWIFAFRNITRSTTDTRSTMGTLVPFFPLGHSASAISFEGDNITQRAILFASLFSSFTFDYILRQKLGGTNFSLFILEQLTFPTPETMTRSKINYNGISEKLDSFLIKRALKLVVTSSSLKCILDELNMEEDPTIWDNLERKRIICEIDAAIAHIYGLSRNNYEHIFTEFRIQRNKDIEEFGVFLTRELCLGFFDKMSLDR